LYFYRSRYYDPTLGRFTQRDKFNEAGFITGNPAVIYNPLQLNDYTYVGNNPLIYTDPLLILTLFYHKTNKILQLN
ncbi:MAG: hypothetical protein M0R46_18045, partial [Candidatus Muirbacterium halophilum]|nr:hypothetical protein [Candidatus Muirbacterium halophilum]